MRLKQYNSKRGVRILSRGRNLAMLSSVICAVACAQRSTPMDVATDSTLFVMVATDLKGDNRFQNLVVSALPYALDPAGELAIRPASARADSFTAARRAALKALEIPVLEDTARPPCVRTGGGAECANYAPTVVSLTLAEPWAEGSRVIAAKAAYRGVVGIHGLVTTAGDSLPAIDWQFAFLMRRDSSAWSVIDRRRYPR